MFSIIICSVHPPYLEQLKPNIEKTIGQPFELLIWDNRDKNMGLCAVYNLMAARAKSPFLCFIHEDILFQSNDWGTELLKVFEQDRDTGLVGIAGSVYKSKTLSGTATGIKSLDRVDILHVNAGKVTLPLFNNPYNVSIEPVVTLDGVFLIARRDVWQEIPFNEELLTGFHLYDLDFSVRVQKKYRVQVLYGVQLTHLTEGGSFGNVWVETTIAWHTKFEKMLPVCTTLKKKEMAGLETEIRKKWLFRLRTENISLRNKIRWVWHSGSLKDLQTWLYIGLFFFGKRYKRPY